MSDNNKINITSGDTDPSILEKLTYDELRIALAENLARGAQSTMEFSQKRGCDRAGDYLGERGFDLETIIDDPAAERLRIPNLSVCAELKR